MKKVLFIAYFFPPLGGSGVQRTLKFVKYLRNYGWDPVVVTVNNSKHIKDESMLEEVSQDIQVIRIDDYYLKAITDDCFDKLINHFKPIYGILDNEELKEEYFRKIEGLFSKIRDELFLPDGMSAWACNVIKQIENYIDFDDIDVVFSTSAPYSDHIIAYNLCNKYNKIWVADFRDEWTNNAHIIMNEECLEYKLERNMERNIVNKANKVIAVTPRAVENYKRIFNLEDNKVELITNGYDEEDFKNIHNNNIINDKFTIVNNGLFYLGMRPDSILQSINSLIDENIIDKYKVCINFIGKCDEDIKHDIVELDKYNLINWMDYLSHIESLEYAVQADLLTLIIGKGERKKAHYPGKMFEYFRLNKPIIAFSPQNSDVEEIIYRTNTGDNVEYDDIQGIKKIILKRYKEWENNTVNYKPDINEIKKYERKALTQKLVEIFDSLVE